MKRELLNVLRPLYDRWGVTRERAIALARSVYMYLNEDRQHYILISNPEDPFFIVTPKNGIICKLVPLAQHMRVVEEDDTAHTEILDTISLIVAGTKPPRLVQSRTYTYLDELTGEYDYHFPIYSIIEPQDAPEDMNPVPPQEIRPVAADFDWKVYCMAFYAFDALTQDMDPLYIPHKTERAMMALNYQPQKTLTINGKPTAGRFLPLAADSRDVYLPTEKSRNLVSQELLLQVTDTEAYYVLHTTVTRFPISILPLTDDSTELPDEPQGEKLSEDYKYISLTEINADMYSYYN